MDAAEERGGELFRAERGRLFGLAYRMLGSVSEAEEVVQDAFLRYESADRADVREPGAYLTTIATRLSIDRLKSARAERETYVGSWLPEPLLLDEADVAGDVVRGESISMAFLVLLETLSPLDAGEFEALPFTSLYLTGNEFAAEMANRIMHGVLHLGWVRERSGDYRGEMAVYVKPNGLLGNAYMAAIKPARYLVVYPHQPPERREDAERPGSRDGAGTETPRSRDEARVTGAGPMHLPPSRPGAFVACAVYGPFRRTHPGRPGQVGRKARGSVASRAFRDPSSGFVAVRDTPSLAVFLSPAIGQVSNTARGAPLGKCVFPPPPREPRIPGRPQKLRVGPESAAPGARGRPSRGSRLGRLGDGRRSPNFVVRGRPGGRDRAARGPRDACRPRSGTVARGRGRAINRRLVASLRQVRVGLSDQKWCSRP